MKHHVKILSIQYVTPDVLQIITEKPENYEFIPGQAADLAIHKKGWEEEKRPFTHTSIPSNDFIEFTIKTYPERKGVTAELLQLHKGDELILHDVFGDIEYKGEGMFIAGGAGITPFLSIIRQLRQEEDIGNNTLLFANKTRVDIIHEQEFKNILGENFFNVLADETKTGYEHGYISKPLIQQHIQNPGQYFYLCGPPPMMETVEKIFDQLQIKPDKIIKEGF